MPDLLIRNLPAELHTRLKVAAVAHRRSVTQETIATLERGLSAPDPSERPILPPALVPRRKITMKETLGYIREGRP
jgi:plasmid stability protein